MLNEYVKRYGNEIVGLNNHEAYNRYVSFCKEAESDCMGFRTFMIKLCTMYSYRTVQKCTRAGMMQVIEKREDDKGLSEFLEGRQAEELNGETVSDCYERYVKICDAMGYWKMTRIDFSRKVCAVLGLKTKSVYSKGEYIRVFAN